MIRRGLLIVALLTVGCDPYTAPMATIPLQFEWELALDRYCMGAGATLSLMVVEDRIHEEVFSPKLCPVIRDTNHWQDVSLPTSAGMALRRIDGAAARHWGYDYQKCFHANWHLEVLKECTP